MIESHPEPRARATGRGGRRGPLLAVTGTVLALLASACGGPAAEAPGPPSVVTPGAEYVAMGSSFASGPGLEPVADEDCFRSQDNYAGRVASSLRLTLVDISCAGSTTESVPVQVESVGSDTKLVTITMGGNDVGYATSLDDYACLDIGLCTDVSVDPAAVEDGLGTVSDRMVAALDTIRDAAPDARLLLVSYPRIAPAEGETCTLWPLTPEHAATVATIGERLDTAFRDAATRSGATLVDLYSASSPRGVCEPDDPWVGGLPPDTAPSGQFPFHPTAGGMGAAADLIVAALRSS